MTTQSRGSRYVAIGSSFAAGPGITPLAPGRPTRARQSRRNYPHLVADRHGLDLVDVTSSGATIENILRSPQFGQSSQISAVTAQTDLVTVTVGGNDIGYIPSLIAACVPSWMSRLPAIGNRLRRATASADASDRLRRTADATAAVFAAIRHRAPGARIMCVNYLTVLPPTYREDLPFVEHEHHRLTSLAADLDAGLASASTAHNVDIINASQHSIDHHAWSDEPWTSGWIRPPSRSVAFHPTADGMASVAGLITDRLASEYDGRGRTV